MGNLRIHYKKELGRQLQILPVLFGFRFIVHHLFQIYVTKLILQPAAVNPAFASKTVMNVPFQNMKKFLHMVVFLKALVGELHST